MLGHYAQLRSRKLVRFRLLINFKESTSNENITAGSIRLGIDNRGKNSQLGISRTKNVGDGSQNCNFNIHAQYSTAHHILQDLATLGEDNADGSILGKPILYRKRENPTSSLKMLSIIIDIPPTTVGR